MMYASRPNNIKGRETDGMAEWIERLSPTKVLKGRETPTPNQAKVTSWQARTCDSAHSWQPYTDAPLGNQAANIMTQHPTQSHYPAPVLAN